MAIATTIALAVTGAALGIVGGIVGYEQQKQQAQVAEENARIQQAQMEYNKRAAEREAAAIEAETAENARRQRAEAERAKAAQRAMLGKSGAALTSGSPLAILGETAADEEKKVMDTHYSGYRAAAAQYSKAADYGVQRDIARYNAGVARSSRPTGLSLGLNIGSSIVSAGTTAAGSIYRYNQISKK